MSKSIKKPLHAIREKCLMCRFGDSDIVSSCELSGCPLHPFRFGKLPSVPKRLIIKQNKRIVDEG